MSVERVPWGPTLGTARCDRVHERIPIDGYRQWWDDFREWAHDYEPEKPKHALRLVCLEFSHAHFGAASDPPNQRHDMDQETCIRALGLEIRGRPLWLGDVRVELAVRHRYDIASHTRYIEDLPARYRLDPPLKYKGHTNPDPHSGLYCVDWRAWPDSCARVIHLADVVGASTIFSPWKMGPSHLRSTDQGNEDTGAAASYWSQRDDDIAVGMMLEKIQAAGFRNHVGRHWHIGDGWSNDEAWWRIADVLGPGLTPPTTAFRINGHPGDFHDDRRPS